MASRDLIDLGIAPDSGTGDSARRGGAKINTLFADIYAHMGDNPVGNDPAGTNYGYRQTFGEYEYKVGEIHPAGRYIPIKFKSGLGAVYDATYGWGMLGPTPFDNDADGIPEIYLDSEWFFLARGDSLGLDLREVDSDGSIHLVLPLAVPGDVIRVRDTFNSWQNKYINIWTTPYEFANGTQVSEWEAATGYTYPDSDSISVNANNADFSSVVPFKAVTSFDDATYPKLSQKFSSSNEGPTGASPINFYDKQLYEINFIYVGPRYGWVCQTIAMNNYDFNAEIDSFKVRMNNFDSDFIVVSAGALSSASEIATLKLNADSDVAEIAQLRRDADSDSIAIQALRTDFDSELSILRLINSSADSDLSNVEINIASDSDIVVSAPIAQTNVKFKGQDPSIRTTYDYDGTDLTVYFEVGVTDGGTF